MSGYAPIVGAFSALAVPAIILLFTLHGPFTPHVASLITFAAGLLIVSMLTSLMGAIGLAAIGAETELTANIPASVMFIAVSVVISVVNILAAFEALSAIYLSHSTSLFVIITAAGGVVGIYFLGFAIGDSWHTGPTAPEDREPWLHEQWIKSHRQAQRSSDLGGLLGMGPIVLGAILRLCSVSVFPTPAAINSIVGVGLGLAIIGTMLGNYRTSHPVEGIEKGLRRWEAYGSIASVSLYILVLLIFMP